MFALASGVPGHELADSRSLALHREVARRVLRDPALLIKARERVANWARSASVHSHYIDAWQKLLDAGVTEVVAALEDEGERGQALRQASPFAFVLSPKERWLILRGTSRKAAQP
jgi:hypothetical protein